MRIQIPLLFHNIDLKIENKSYKTRAWLYVGELARKAS